MHKWRKSITYLVPATLVAGTGAEVFAVPPVELVPYHSSEFPEAAVAVSATVTAPSQYDTDDTEGAAGTADTVIVAVTMEGQPFEVAV